jgi:hypothetical protein
MNIIPPENISTTTDSSSSTNDNTSTYLNSPRKEIKESFIITLLEKNIHLPNYTLSDEQKQWIQIILKDSPASFEEIDKFLEPILYTGQLNIEIIPKFIKLIADIYNSISQEKNIFDENNIYILIKFTMDVVIDFIPLQDFEIFIIKSIIDSSISLLITTIGELKSKKTNFTNTSSLVDISFNIIPEEKEDTTEIPSGFKTNCCWNTKLF